MRYRIFIGVLLLALLLSGCRHESALSVADMPKLSITLEIPAAPGTKKDEGEVASEIEEENEIYDLKIWIFKHPKPGENTHVLIKYATSNSIDPSDSKLVKLDELPQAGTAKKYAFSVDRSLATDDPRPTLDIFVLANSASIGCTLGKEASYETLTAAAFGTDGVYAGDFFGPVDPVTPTALHEAETKKGLPMSGMGEDLSISGEDYSLSVGKITLLRAVSKLRYVFCQTLNTGEDAETMEVLRVELDQQLIPEQEFIFSPTGGAHVSEGYVDQGIVTKPAEPATYYTVPSSAIPELYTYTGSGASGAADYERLVLGAIKEEKLLNPATYYLRESDKPLTGKVFYQVRKNNAIVPDKNGDDVRCKTFKMEAPDFARNHSWTMYGYFISERTLILVLKVLPWDMNTYDIDFLNSSASVTVPLTVDPFSVSSIEHVEGTEDDFIVNMKSNAPAKAYLNIVTPDGGLFVVKAIGVDGSDQYFDITLNDLKKNVLETTINSRTNQGRIDITIAANPDLVNFSHGKYITLDFEVYTPDEDNPQRIDLGTEAINQNYIFTLP